ncbi:type II toxin-antitoxin system death-on-curing family toxin [Paracoccus sp. CPCC 101403]|uniref:Type II toxin-antitoxin system death-on-curing family toxin n=1 Tax=Paracoccus broussonetiae TaxID=3075834 RepID=A0ABU3EJG3_9RHOB|nr:type II toxin-antitoxin system death-on-curing family toxin [Paracoccus sp. CPCC 101403]MDT1064364.1 type II toxin-antitoxin system death-on-curing family toxin [Paracoccus sp. CPCC 101403]
MTDWIWVPLGALTVIHDRQISRHGGASGMRDAALLEMGCARAINLAAYGSPDVFDIAAAYAFGISKAHAFVDGNKRTAFVASFTFLRLNGLKLRPEPLEGVRMMEDLASGAATETSFASWLRALSVQQEAKAENG